MEGEYTTVYTVTVHDVTTDLQFREFETPSHPRKFIIGIITQSAK
jgi:hypothetical protein